MIKAYIPLNLYNEMIEDKGDDSISRYVRELIRDRTEQKKKITINDYTCVECGEALRSPAFMGRSYCLGCGRTHIITEQKRIAMNDYICAECGEAVRPPGYMGRSFCLDCEGYNYAIQKTAVSGDPSDIKAITSDNQNSSQTTL